MKIIIGREEQGSRLHLMVVNEQGQTVKDICHGQQQSVNMSVSRQHLSLTLNDDGTFTLENLKMQNITFVNGMQVNRTIVTQNDRIELGHERYLFDWGAVKPLLPQIADIKPLKAVFDEYEQETAKINKQQQVFNAMRGGKSRLPDVDRSSSGRRRTFFLNGDRQDPHLPQVVAKFISRSAHDGIRCDGNDNRDGV